jgi:hypothetical protein
MSSFGTAFVIDTPPGVATAIVDQYSHEHAREAYVLRSADGWRRVSAYLDEPGRLNELLELAVSVGTARFVVAEDFDEYGALWAVVTAVDSTARVLHRRWILNADPDDEEAVETAIQDNDGDPRASDVTGDAALFAVAQLFGVDISRLSDADEESASAWMQIGVIGGPFPWWDALGLPWPEPGIGQQLS